MTDKLKKPPRATPKLATPKDVEVNFETHRQHLEHLTNTVNDLIDKLRASGVEGV